MRSIVFNTADKAGELGTRIEWAAPSIVAAATPERFFGALTSADFESGFINRFLILPFEGHKRPAEQTRVVEPPPKELVEKLKKLLGPQNGTILERPIGGGLAKCHIPWADDEAQQLYLKFSREMGFQRIWRTSSI
jgi:hypothetical protein